MDEQSPTIVKPPRVMAFYLRVLQKELADRYRRPPLANKAAAPDAEPLYAKAIQLLLAHPKREKAVPSDTQSRAILEALRKGADASTGRSPFALGGSAHTHGWRAARTIARALVGLLRTASSEKLTQKQWDAGIRDALGALRVSHDFRRGANLGLWVGLVRDENAHLDQLATLLTKPDLPLGAVRSLRDGLRRLEDSMPTYRDALRLNTLVMEGKFTASFDKQWKAPAGMLSPREQTAARLQDMARVGPAITSAWLFARVLHAKLDKDLVGKSWKFLESELQKVRKKLATTKSGPQLMIRSLLSTSRRAVSPRQRMRLLRVACELLIARGEKGPFVPALAKLGVTPPADDPATDKPFEYRLENGAARLESPRDLGFVPPRQQLRRGRAPRPRDQRWCGPTHPSQHRAAIFARTAPRQAWYCNCRREAELSTREGLRRRPELCMVGRLVNSVRGSCSSF